MRLKHFYAFYLLELLLLSLQSDLDDLKRVYEDTLGESRTQPGQHKRLKQYKPKLKAQKITGCMNAN